MNAKTWLSLAIGAMACVGAWAQTDATHYLANPSFEQDAALCGPSAQVVNDADGLRGYKVAPSGWTLKTAGVDLLVNANCYTDNNFGKVASLPDGDYAFYQRVGWSNTSSQLSQATAALPAGDYELAFASKAFCANNAASTAAYAVKDASGSVLAENSFSCAPGSNGIMASSLWNVRKLRFRLAQEQPVTIVLDMNWLSGGSCMLFDNFTLTRLPDGSLDQGAEIEGGTEDEVQSPIEGLLGGDFVSEADMKADLLQMLASFTQYAKSIYVSAGNNSKGEATGYFKGNSAGQNNEDGVRTNADLAMVCAFVCQYGPSAGVKLPQGITYANLKDMAKKALVYGYSTHKANALLKTTNNGYWGSTSKSDSQWESSLWAMSLAYASHFLRDDLSADQKQRIYNMIKAECNYELERSIPVGYNGDTKAEENGWEADILACALGLYPDDALAPKWFDRLRAFAINSYSQQDDATDTTVIDPDYDSKTVADYYLGACLYPDFTLQNHNYFHTSYQNVVIQELGEARLAMALFQGENPRWSTNALMHNCPEVMSHVLRYLALSDGELAMPNGNDWSMFLFDQITSYSTLACFGGDPDALLLENLAYLNIKARQQTTPDGSWLLNSDIGPRRMGVEAHRVMMTYLMHELCPTSAMQPTAWDNFRASVQDAMVIRSQNIVRASTPDRYTIFSWSNGLGNYTGYFVPNDPNLAKIVVPYKANKTGNLLGWYTVDGKSTDAAPVVSGIYQLDGSAWAMNGKLNVNGGALENNFALYSTPGNALIYVDYVSARSACTVSKEYGGLLAISVDPFLKSQRTLYHANGRFQSDGSSFKQFASPWVNVDNAIGVAVAGDANKMAFGERGLSNSVYVAKLLTSYDNASRSYAAGDIVDRRAIAYYSGVDAAATKALSDSLVSLTAQVPDGWNGVIASDPDGSRYLLLCNFVGEPECALSGLKFYAGAPVLPQPTAISADVSSAKMLCDAGHSIACPLNVYIAGSGVTACLAKDNANAAIITAADKAAEIEITILDARASATVPAGASIKAAYIDGAIVIEDYAGADDEETYIDVTAKLMANPGFELDNTWATVGAITLNGVAYDPCYVQDVKPASSDFPQVLPVEDWESATKLEAATNYSLLYSMPYSTDMYCVSPSSLGNSASIMARPALFPEAENRCLSVLNSWTKGDNAITRTVSLPAGNYKLKFLAQYVCANEMGRTADGAISTSGGNLNYSLCGVKVGDAADFRFPDQANTWQQITIPFSLEADGQAVISMGLRTTQSTGAANITRLYLDDVRIYSEKDINTEGQAVLPAAAEVVDVYDLQGIAVRRGVSRAAAADGLPAGLYVIGGEKVIVR